MDEQNSAEDKNLKQQAAPTNTEDLSAELAQKIEEQRLKNIESVRALHPQAILNPKQHEILLSIKEEELTDADKFRIAWATLRLKHHTYTGTGYSIKQKQKVKAKRKMAKKSRKANR